MMLPISGPTEDVKYEDLKKFVVSDDLERFFLGWASTTSLGEGRAGRVSQEER